MPRGSGAIVVHRHIEQGISGYHVIPYNPRLEFAPFLLRGIDVGQAKLIHTAPDHAIFHARPGVPLVITFHNYVLDPFMRRYSSVLQRLHHRTDLRFFTQRALARADMVTAVSRFAAELVRHDAGYRGEIRVISNGIDASVFQPRRGTKKTSNLVVLFSGNLSARKGAPLLPQIAKRLDAGIQILCAAPRSHEKRFAADYLEFIGPIAYDEMPRLYNEVDLLLMPTVREGFGLAVAEAMACGLPVVATDCSTMPELVTDGRGGYLCKLGDAEDFAEKINMLAKAPQVRREMGEYNRAVIEQRYTLQQMIESYRNLFEEVVSR